MLLFRAIFVIQLCSVALCGIFDSVVNFAKENTYCRLSECCEAVYIPNQLPDFREVFGQHLATSSVTKALLAFYKRPGGAKPLVLSFHGTPGTGKNFIAEHIVRARYKLGKSSKYVHGYTGRGDFPLDELAPKYGDQMRKEIEARVRDCGQSTFIFDEVDKMPRGVFESIVGFLDHNTFHNVDFSKSLFIFISNSGGVEIANLLSQLMRKQGLSREDTELMHFEREIELTAYNSEGGLQGSRNIEKAVIDYYIPFLPLEQRHVEMCIKRLIAQRTDTPQPKIVAKIIKSIPFEVDTNRFAASGCKKLEARVDVELHSEL